MDADTIATEQEACHAYRQAAPHDADGWLMAVQVEDVWCVGLMTEDGIRGRVYPNGQVEVSRGPVWHARLERVFGWIPAVLITWGGLLALGVVLRLLHVTSQDTSRTLAEWWIGVSAVAFFLAT